jgi:hypothetical protein
MSNAKSRWGAIVPRRSVFPLLSGTRGSARDDFTRAPQAQITRAVGLPLPDDD